MKLSGDILILNESKRCPRCRVEGAIDWPTRKCRRCGLRVLKANDSFRYLVEVEGLRSFYVFFGSGLRQGWVASDYLLMPDLQPNLLSDKAMAAPDKNYGTRALPKGCSAE